MTTYPLEAGEAEPFVPASLAHLPNAPTFYLRWGTPREKEQQRRVADEEGLIHWAEDSMRKEMLRGMKELLSPDDFAVWEPQAKGWWDALDVYQQQNKDVPAAERPPFVFEGQDLLTEILEQLARDWRPYRLMEADNKAYQRGLGPAINSVIIARFENFEAPAVKRGRYLTYDCVRDIAERLDRFGRTNAPDATLRPSQELGMECMKRLFLDKEREGNSVLPAQSDPTPDTSKPGTGGTSGKSTASGRSRKTRATSSATRNGR